MLWFHTTDLEFYAYDSVRTAWLGVVERTVQMGRESSLTVNHYLRVAGRTEASPTKQAGWYVPHALTVTGYHWANRNNTASDWAHRLCIWDEGASASNTSYHATSPAGSYQHFKTIGISKDYDIDDRMGFLMIAGGSVSAVQDQSVTITYRRRPS